MTTQVTVKYANHPVRIKQFDPVSGKEHCTETLTEGTKTLCVHSYHAALIEEIHDYKDGIFINGVSISALKAQRESLKQGASKFVSDAIEKVKQLVNEILESENVGEVEAKADEAFELLDNAKIVSGVTGVLYSLPYYEECGQYEYSETLSGMLEDNDNEAVKLEYGSSVYKLYDLLGGMEINCRDWYSSRC